MNPAVDPSTSSLRIPISGMTCAACASRLQRVLVREPGVLDASVNFADETAHLTVASEPPPLAQVLETIARTGFTGRTAQAEVALGDLRADGGDRARAALLAVPGVVDVRLLSDTARAEITFVPGMSGPGAWRKAVESVGGRLESGDAGPSPVELRRAEREQEERALLRDVRLAVAFTLPIFVLDMGSMFLPPLHALLDRTLGTFGLHVVLFVLASVVQFGPGRRFLVRGWPALRSGTPDMNSLVMLGTSAAWGYSVIATFAAGLLPAGAVHVYFEAAAVIITLVLVGRWLEARARGKTSEAMTHLLGLQARTARVIDDSGEEDRPIEGVRPGDRLRIRPGERVPLDGIVVEGTSWVDESMITGEPVPVRRGAGDEVIGGTTNTAGGIVVEVSRTGADTTLSQIVRLVEEAQATRIPIQAAVDRVVRIFVPAVLVVAALTFVAWMVLGAAPALPSALVHAVAVLIIACPCAMGLATPVSIMVGTGRGARIGVLFRQGSALELLRETRVVAMDKTGTLTRGEPALRALLTDPNAAAEDIPVVDDALLARIAAVERGSEHPVGRAIVSAAQERGLTLPEAADFASETGRGVTATVEGRRMVVGSEAMMSEAGLDTSAWASAARVRESRGETVLYAAEDGRLACLIAVADSIREGAREAVESLREMGREVVMITGDRRGTAEAIAADLGIDHVEAEVHPAGKAETIRALQRAEGGGQRRVAFVGDGINDAPALAGADVGIAVGSGTDVAIESAHVVLMRPDLRRVPQAIALSEATLRNIRQNLFWAFAYNITLIPVAAGLLVPIWGISLSPMLAAGAMGLSSVFVLTNALRLRRWGAAPERVRVADAA